MKETKHIVLVRNSTIGNCEYCENLSGFMNYFDDLINHYINEHGFELLHVGQETTRDDKGTPWHDMVAVLGNKKILNKNPIPKIDLK